MMNMHSKYNNMHKNKMFYALNCINNHVITSISYVLSMICNEILGEDSGNIKEGVLDDFLYIKILN